MSEASSTPTTQATQILARPEALPLRSVESILAARVLVVAPHPDDECLGCGGAVALLSGGCDLRVVVVSDGTMSHPNSRQFPAAALQALRESETQAALSNLGVEPAAIRFLGLPDGAVPAEGAAFDAAVAQCCDYLAEAAPQLIFLPWRADPHPDHRASWRLMDTALKRLRTAPRRLEYPIWDWDEAQRGNIESHILAWRLDIQQVVQQKRHAVQLYRSQVSDLINDDPDGFCLSAEMISHFSQPWEVYFEEIA